MLKRNGSQARCLAPVFHMPARPTLSLLPAYRQIDLLIIAPTIEIHVETGVAGAFVVFDTQSRNMDRAATGLSGKLVGNIEHELLDLSLIHIS